MAIRDPAWAIQAAVFAALTASPDMATAFGGPPSVYDTVPLAPSGLVDTAAFPYCTIGDDQLIGETNQTGDVTETFVKVETWSRATDNGEVKLIAGAVRAALDQSIALLGHGVITHTFRGTIYRRSPDGLTRHAITTIRFLTAPIGLSPASP